MVSIHRYLRRPGLHRVRAAAVQLRSSRLTTPDAMASNLRRHVHTYPPRAPEITVRRLDDQILRPYVMERARRHCGNGCPHCARAMPGLLWAVLSTLSSAMASRGHPAGNLHRRRDRAVTVRYRYSLAMTLRVAESSPTSTKYPRLRHEGRVALQCGSAFCAGL